ncbi:hypothetical protein SY88_18425 [Clostridiales bacterium PH28_bin88]|nr:hypothetical protein SY88_18425 [Clostridiales bacterium PH28_bin88]
MQIAFEPGVADFIREQGGTVLITAHVPEKGCCITVPIPQIEMGKPKEGETGFLREEVEGVEVFFQKHLAVYPGAKVSLNRFLRWKKLSVRVQGLI